jgi:hypothetical protein
MRIKIVRDDDLNNDDRYITMTMTMISCVCAEKWATPVGVVVGLLLFIGLAFAMVYFYRKDRL